MEHECTIGDMLGDICAADHVFKIPQTFTLCSGMTANWRCTMEGLLVPLVYNIICFTCRFLGDGQWKYYKQENAHTVSLLSHTAKDYDNVHSLYPPPLFSIFPSFFHCSPIYFLFLPPPLCHFLSPLTSSYNLLSAWLQRSQLGTCCQSWLPC